MKVTLEDSLPKGIEVLHDYSRSGRERPWHTLKRASEAMSDIYKSVSLRKGYRMAECADFLVFGRTADGRLRLKKAAFCHVRLCPMCSWRRALKVQAQMHEIVDALEVDKPAYAFLTLSAGARVFGAELSQRLDDMAVAWHRLTSGRTWRQYVRGWYRALEVTHDTSRVITPAMYHRKMDWCIRRGLAIGDVNPLYDTYHAHYHVLLVLPGNIKSLLSLLMAGADPARYDLPQRRRNKLSVWEVLWADAMRHDCIPEGDCQYIRRDRDSDMIKAVCEAGKYTVKTSDILVPNDDDLSRSAIRVLDQALHKRRLIAWGGCMAEVRRRLSLDDPETGDFVGQKADEDMIGEVSYRWHSGLRFYRLYK